MNIRSLHPKVDLGSLKIGDRLSLSDAPGFEAAMRQRIYRYRKHHPEKRLALMRSTDGWILARGDDL